MAQGWNSISHPLVPASALNTQLSRFSCSGEFIRGVQKQLILWGPRLPFAVFLFGAFLGQMWSRLGQWLPLLHETVWWRLWMSWELLLSLNKHCLVARRTTPQPVTCKAVSPLGPAIVFHGCLQHWNHGIWIRGEAIAIH